MLRGNDILLTFEEEINSGDESRIGKADYSVGNYNKFTTDNHENAILTLENFRW